MKKRGFSIFPKSMKTKHDWGDTVRVSGIYECSLCGNYEAFKKGENFSECQDCINSKRTEDNKWYPTNEFIYFLSKNTNIEFYKLSGISTRIADGIAGYAGTIGFFMLHVIWFTAWVLANTGFFGPEYMFDPFPFGLLTMIVSLEAIFLSTFILISQNIAAKKSELRAEHEYQVNLETEKNVAEILAMVKDIRTENSIRTEHIVDIKETVEEISEHIESDDEADSGVSRDKNIDDKIDKHIEERIEEKIEEHIEQHEKESFEEHEKMLDEIGIDIIPESAPPAVMEEEEIAIKEATEKSRAGKKERKSKTQKSKSAPKKKITKTKAQSKK
jgi:uncharacterized membrane protein